MFRSNDGALPLHVFHNLRCQCALIRQAHLGGKRRVGDPLAGSPSRGLFQHAVHLFERQALGLRNEEVGVDEAADAEGAPDEEDLGAEVAFVGSDHVWGDDCDDLEEEILVS